MFGITTIQWKILGAVLAIALLGGVPAYVHTRYVAALEAAEVTGEHRQYTYDLLRADSVRDSVERSKQVWLDSVLQERYWKWARERATYGTVLTQKVVEEKMRVDTVFRDVVQQANATIAACNDALEACQRARENAERDAARLRLAVRERDDTLAVWAKRAIAPPRSCVAAATDGAIIGGVVVEGLHLLGVLRH